LSNFLEGCGPKEIGPYLKDILLLCFSKLTDGCSLVKENAVSSISSAVEASLKEFE